MFFDVCDVNSRQQAVDQAVPLPRISSMLSIGSLVSLLHEFAWDERK
jgi:hypothetical protein